MCVSVVVKSLELLLGRSCCLGSLWVCGNTGVCVYFGPTPAPFLPWIDQCKTVRGLVR